LVFDEKNHPQLDYLQVSEVRIWFKTASGVWYCMVAESHQYAPEQVSGCLLADDMGLGKTLQLLCFIGEYLENAKDKKPVLVVAPVSFVRKLGGRSKSFL
jgi:hypothetical protein